MATTSDKQLAANRANAQYSTGPQSPEGKARVAGNRRTHGLAGRRVILPTESQADYDALLDSLLEEFSPASTFEDILVHQMAEAHWKLRRIGRQEAEFLAAHPNPFLEDNPEPARKLAQLSRYEASARRAFHRAVEDLRRHRAEREKQHRRLAIETLDTAIDNSNPIPADPLPPKPLGEPQPAAQPWRGPRPQPHDLMRDQQHDS